MIIIYNKKWRNHKIIIIIHKSNHKKMLIMRNHMINLKYKIKNKINYMKGYKILHLTLLIIDYALYILHK